MVKVISKYPTSISFILNSERIVINGADYETILGESINGTTIIKKDCWSEICKKYKDSTIIKNEYINAISIDDYSKNSIDIDKELVDGIDVEKTVKNSIKTKEKTVKN